MNEVSQKEKEQKKTARPTRWLQNIRVAVNYGHTSLENPPGEDKELIAAVTANS